MIILPGKKLFNRFSKKDRPKWQERYDKRERLLMFVGPWMWTPEDFAFLGPFPPEIMKSVSSFPYGTTAAAAGGGGSGGPDVSLSIISVFNTDTSSIQAGFRYETDGGLLVTNSSGTYTERLAEWVASNDKSTGLGTDYEAYADETTNTQGVHTGGWTDSTTYTTISSDLQLQCDAAIQGQIRQSNGQTSVREKADTNNVATVNFSLYAEYEDIGIGVFVGQGVPP